VYTETGTLVDDISKYYDNTDLDTVQDAARRRNKLLQFVNRARDEIWWWRSWPWTWTSTTLTMSSGEASRPADFAQVGTHGGMYDANGRPWVEINWQDMQTLRKRNVRVNDRLFSVGSNIQIPNTGSSQQFTFIYRQVPTNLTYGADIDPVPSHFGHALLLGSVARMKEEEGDPRSIWRDDFLRALSRAMMTERETASRPLQMPMAVGGKW
jgi:hypothetical protein